MIPATRRPIAPEARVMTGQREAQAKLRAMITVITVEKFEFYLFIFHVHAMTPHHQIWVRARLCKGHESPNASGEPLSLCLSSRRRGQSSMR